MPCACSKYIRGYKAKVQETDVLAYFILANLF